MSFLNRLFGTSKSDQPQAEHSGTTFRVSDVKPASEPLAETPCRHAVSEFLRSPVEACSSYRGELVAGVRSHPLIATLHAAFTGHRPVVLSPDIIWLTLTQGFAQHINANAERLRRMLVPHDGKLQITVRRDDFIKGSPENPWPEVFDQFSAAIKEHLGATHGLIVSDFSTTGPVERAASEITLMDSMQAFFRYEVATLCGIPSVTLEGTVQDWRRIAECVQEFRRFDLDWWVPFLEPVLDQFVAAASGEVDRDFWDSIYKWHGPKGSGSPYVTGWIKDFFPYLCHGSSPRDSNPDLKRNESLGAPDAHFGRNVFASLPAKAPFVWNSLATQYEMEFIGGLCGIRQEPQTLRLRPEIGWAVREKPSVSTPAKEQKWPLEYASTPRFVL
jgi:hypothetical protein